MWSRSSSCGRWRRQDADDRCVPDPGRRHRDALVLLRRRLVEGILTMYENGGHREIYHIGSDEEITIRDLAARIGKIVGIDLDIRPGARRPRAATRRRCPDISKMRGAGVVTGGQSRRRPRAHGGVVPRAPRRRPRQRSDVARPFSGEQTQKHPNAPRLGCFCVCSRNTQSRVHPQIRVGALSALAYHRHDRRVFLDQVFAANDGLATTSQLRAVMSRKMIASHVRTGTIVRVWHGVYALNPPDVNGRLAALDLIAEKPIVACMNTAAELYGFDTVQDSLTHILDPGVRMRPVKGLMVHQRIGAPLRRVQGRLATAPAWTAVEVARTLRRPRALATLDAALHIGACSTVEIEAAIREQKGRRGIVKVRELHGACRWPRRIADGK